MEALNDTFQSGRQKLHYSPCVVEIWEQESKIKYMSSSIMFGTAEKNMGKWSSLVWKEEKRTKSRGVVQMTGIPKEISVLLTLIIFFRLGSRVFPLVSLSFRSWTSASIAITYNVTGYLTDILREEN